jgi:hypothetical protein
MNTAMRELRLKKTLVVILTLFLAAALHAVHIIDQPIPGAKGVGITIHVQPGIKGNDFHVTYETGNAWYVYYNGSSWSSPIQIGKVAFRSGYKMAVDSKGDVHFAWPESQRGNSKYRKLCSGQLSSAESVIGSHSWAECDIIVDMQDNIYMIGTINGFSQLGLFKKEGSGWKKSELPKKSGDYWAPCLHIAENGRMWVASRSNDGRNRGSWWVKDAGKAWEGPFTVGKHFPPSGTAWGDRFVFASNNGGPTDHVTYKSGGSHTVKRSKLPDGARQVRGQHVGVGKADNGIVFACYSNMGITSDGADLTNRNLESSDRLNLTWSTDNGDSWKTPQKMGTGSGQGHGNLAVNGNWVMVVWPDMRDGQHVRFSILDARKFGDAIAVARAYNLVSKRSVDASERKAMVVFQRQNDSRFSNRYAEFTLKGRCCSSVRKACGLIVGKQ